MAKTVGFSQYWVERPIDGTLAGSRSRLMIAYVSDRACMALVCCYGTYHFLHSYQAVHRLLNILNLYPKCSGFLRVCSEEDVSINSHRRKRCRAYPPTTAPPSPPINCRIDPLNNSKNDPSSPDVLEGEPGSGVRSTVSYAGLVVSVLVSVPVDSFGVRCVLPADPFGESCMVLVCSRPVLSITRN